MRDLPSIETLRQTFVVYDGNLYWRTRFKLAGTINTKGYRVVNFAKQMFRAHRIIFALANNRWPTLQIDHINGDKLDNRLENLREATAFQNCHNRSIGVRNKSGRKGVFWNKAENRWQARITVNGTRIFLGSHKDVALAAFIYECAAEKYHGEFARL